MNQEQAAQAVSCPLCLAPPNRPCNRANGAPLVYLRNQLKHPHRERIDKAKQTK
jgi:hypothetical protein